MPPPAVRIYKDVCFISGSNCRKNGKSDDLNGHRFCDKKSITQKRQNPIHSTASFLFSVRFVSDAALLRSLLCLVCRSSDSSIQAARLIAAYDLAPYCQRIASAFSPGHDSPSNDRFSPHVGIPRMENNTLESQLLSESCRTACNLKCTDCNPAIDSFRVRDLHPIPLFSEQACVSD